jgi:4-amino-4-deoxy-L-arabinose transferase-like glycosyltransferase
MQTFTLELPTHFPKHRRLQQLSVSPADYRGRKVGGLFAPVIGRWPADSPAVNPLSPQMMRTSPVEPHTWRPDAVHAGTGVAERRALALILLVALVIRLGLFWFARDTSPQIVDEQHYSTLARNVADGIGFAWDAARPTSIRPPFFPFFVAALWKITGTDGPAIVRLAQVPLSVASVWVLYLIGRRLFTARIGLIAAAGLAVYPSLLYSGVLVLSETLFTLLLLTTILGCLVVIDRRSTWAAILTGASLGAAALTRSVLWPFIIVLVGAALIGLSGTLGARLRVAACLVLGYALVVGPWSYRNTKLQGVFEVVDTMGGLNMLMGNYEHTPEEHMWDAVLMTGDTAWTALLPPLAPDGRHWTEGTKDKWAQKQAVEFMKTHPGTTVRRSVLKLADFWGLERDFIAAVQRGAYHPPTWVFIVCALAITLSYVGLMILAVMGIVAARPVDWRAHVLLIGIILFISGIHAVVFGHSRYHLPLVPILLLYAAAAIERRAWRMRWRSAMGIVTMGLLAMLGGFWVHEVFIRDASRLADLGRWLGLS